jgi:Na+/proline symporter
MYLSHIIFPICIKMNDFHKLNLKFFLGCIGSRVLFSILLQYTPDSLCIPLSILTTMISIGFAVLWIFDLRQKKGAFNNDIWWNTLRMIHAFLFGLVSWFLFQKKQYLASTVILLDTTVGFWSFIIHHHGKRIKQIFIA